MSENLDSGRCEEVPDVRVRPIRLATRCTCPDRTAVPCGNAPFQCLMHGAVRKPVSGRTTAPVRSTQGAPGVRRLFQIRWVWPSALGPVTPLEGPRAVIGRDEDCDTVLPGPETSRRHAEIRKVGPVFVLRDLQSRNG